MRSTDLGHATFFIFRSSLLQNNHALSLPPPLSLCLHHARFRSRYSYDLWTNDPRGISPKDWPNRDSTPSCPSRWHCVSSCNATRIIPSPGWDTVEVRVESVSWTVYRITTTRTVSMGSGTKIRIVESIKHRLCMQSYLGVSRWPSLWWNVHKSIPPIPVYF